MAQRGRKSAASNIIPIGATAMQPALNPSRPLNKAEKQIFDLVAKEHRHLRVHDSILLTTFAIACAETQRTKDPAEFERFARISLAAAVKLRLTPSSVMEPRSLGRKYADVQQSSLRKPWDRTPLDGDDDDADAH
jgi:hypothetical protein